MSVSERTRQQLDPIGTLSSRLFAVVLAAVALCYALILTVRSSDQVSNPALAALALLWLVGACLTIVVGTSPARAPFTRAGHVVVQLLVLGSIALSIASQWGTNRLIQDDFGSVALGVLMLALGPYRPAIELAAVGSLSAIFVGFLTLLEVPNLESTTPPVAFVLVGMAPILALSYASAAYSGGLVASLERWQRGAIRSVGSGAGRIMDGITRAVQQDRVTILGRDVLPFFSSILETDAVTSDDRVRAREISNSIRGIMVAEADRSWLEVVVGVPYADAASGVSAVVDRDGRAAAMGTDQRTALRALLVALLDEPCYVSGSLRIELTGTDSRCHGVLTATLNANDSFVRSVFSPYLAVMRVGFSRLQVDFQRPALRLKFSYEQR
ncbi:MAG TPA: hypothetical protein VIQ78_05970 [Terrimesophilobacter sp.]|jgi:hypothetical protein|uniref:hypothetical protein n=1 Tax=Terrimesophilobacter sp. TaxID=2906435 RepID=UPI002F95C9FA